MIKILLLHHRKLSESSRVGKWILFVLVDFDARA